MLNILLVNLVQFELQEKPSHVRKDFFCILNLNVVSIDFCKVDDNESYGKYVTAKHIFQVTFFCTGDIESVQTCRVDKNDSIYINIGEGRTYIKKYLDNHKSVYKLNGTYSCSIANPGFCTHYCDY